MAQYFRDPFVFQNIDDTYQVCQISYHDERVVEILYRPATGRPVIQDNGQWFELRSPDIKDLSIFNVLEALGYAAENFVITWPEQCNIPRNTLVRDARLFQAALYPAGAPIPDQVGRGPLPQQANH